MLNRKVRMNYRIVFTTLSVLFFNYVLIGKIKHDTSHKVGLVKQIAMEHGESENIQQFLKELKNKSLLSTSIRRRAADELGKESNSSNISSEERLKKRSAKHILNYLVKYDTDGTGYKVALIKRTALEHGEGENTQQFREKLKQIYNESIPPTPILMQAASELNEESNNSDISPEKRLENRSAQHLLSSLAKQEKRSWREKHPNYNTAIGLTTGIIVGVVFTYTCLGPAIMFGTFCKFLEQTSGSQPEKK